MRRQELRIVSRAAIGLAAALAALATAVLTAESGEAVIRTAWTAGGGHLAQARDMLLALVHDPVASHVAALFAATLLLAALAARNLRAANVDARSRNRRQRRPRD